MVSRLASTWAAVRYRRSQSIALVLVSALVTTCAVFAPMFVRTLEQGLLRARLVERDVADTTVLLHAVRTHGRAPSTTPGDIATVMPSEALDWFGGRRGDDHGPHHGAATPGLQPSPLRLVARDDVCDHLELASGAARPRRARCSSPSRTRRRGGGPRAPSSTSPTRRSSPAPTLPWHGPAHRHRRLPPSRTRLLAAHRRSTASRVSSSAKGLTTFPAIDDFVTDERTFAAGGPGGGLRGVPARPVAGVAHAPSHASAGAVRPRRTRRGCRGDDPAARPRLLDRLRPRPSCAPWCRCCSRSWPCSPSRCSPSSRTRPSSSAGPRSGWPGCVAAAARVARGSSCSSWP